MIFHSKYIQNGRSEVNRRDIEMFIKSYKSFKHILNRTIQLMICHVLSPSEGSQLTNWARISFIRSKLLWPMSSTLIGKMSAYTGLYANQKCKLLYDTHGFLYPDIPIIMEEFNGVLMQFPTLVFFTLE